MITIKPSPTADTRTCDFANVSKETLLESSRQHDPYCDCGLCQYCKGDEDKLGNPTRSSEVEGIRGKVLITASIECSECGNAKSENLQGGNLRTIRPEFAMAVWKHGWIVEFNEVLCPNCRADAEEWRSI